MHKTISQALLLAAFFYVTASAVAKESSTEIIRFHVNYQLVISAEGRIEKLVPQKQDSSTALAENLEKQIRRWKFTPGLLDGKPARTESNLWLAVEATPVKEGAYQVNVVDAKTGAWLAKSGLTQPEYPISALRFGHEAVLRLLIHYDAEGKVVKAERLGEFINGILPFERASIQAAKQWRFEPEKIGGVGVPGRVMVPVSFCVSDSMCRGLLSGDKEKEAMAQDLARQWSPIGSQVAIQRPQVN